MPTQEPPGPSRRMIVFLLRFALCALAAGSLGCTLVREPVPDKLPVYSARAVTGELAAGAAAVDITPDRDLYMGGFAPLRKSRGVHDPLYARALVLQRGDVELALVAVDLIGMMRTDVQAIQARLSGLDPRHTIVSSTHNHHSPDTMGLWGMPPFVSGADPAYMARVQQGVVEAIQRARSALRPAEVGAGKTAFDPRGFIKNSSRPGLVDPEVLVLHVREPGGGPTIATVVELGCHPEVVKRTNRMITADFPGWTVAELEGELGGMAMYVSGALGALVSPDRQPSPGDPERWSEAERIGVLLADHAREALRSIERYERAPALAVWHSPVYLSSENWRYDLLRWSGIVDRQVYGRGYLESEVNLWRIGDLVLAAVPGELSPDLGLRIKSATGREHTMILGLANDELGYLVPPWDYEMSYYDYERTLCLGRDAGWSVVARLEDLALLARYSRN
jgi:hypothetical protein